MPSKANYDAGYTGTLTTAPLQPLAQPLALKLKPKQMAFLRSTAPFTLFIGGVGSGKTYVGATRAILHALGWPGSEGLVCAPTYKMLETVTQKMLFQLLPAWAKGSYNKNSRILQLPNGSSILFASLEVPENIRGLNVAWAWVDEAPLCGHYAWQLVKQRVGRQPGHKDWLSQWGTGTPRGRDGFYREFEQPTTKLPGHYLIRSSTRENASNLPSGYIEGLGFSGGFYEQEIEGKFTAFEGLVYHFDSNEDDPDSHITDDARGCLPIAAFAERIGGVDWGGTNPSVGLVFGIDYDDRVTQLDEYYQRGVSDSDHIRELVRLTEQYHVSVWYCDPARPGALLALKQALDGAGLNCVVRKANNAKIDGIETVTRFLQLTTDPNTPTGQTPGLKIHRRCINTIAEFSSYCYPKQAQVKLNSGTQLSEDKNTPDEPIKQNDHAMDALRYALHSHLSGAGRTRIAFQAVSQDLSPAALLLLQTRQQHQDTPLPLEVSARAQEQAKRERELRNAKFLASLDPWLRAQQ